MYDLYTIPNKVFFLGSSSNINHVHVCLFFFYLARWLSCFSILDSGTIKDNSFNLEVVPISLVSAICCLVLVSWWVCAHTCKDAWASLSTPSGSASCSQVDIKGLHLQLSLLGCATGSNHCRSGVSTLAQDRNTTDWRWLQRKAILWQTVVLARSSAYHNQEGGKGQWEQRAKQCAEGWTRRGGDLCLKRNRKEKDYLWIIRANEIKERLKFGLLNLCKTEMKHNIKASFLSVLLLFPCSAKPKTMLNIMENIWGLLLLTKSCFDVWRLCLF